MGGWWTKKKHSIAGRWTLSARQLYVMVNIQAMIEGVSIKTIKNHLVGRQNLENLAQRNDWQTEDWGYDQVNIV